MRIQDLNNKNIYIWGTGVEGQAVMEYLKDLPFKIIENNQIPEDAEVIIKSPGVSNYLPQIAEAKAKGVKFTSLLNIFFSNLTYKPTTIAVTGTKGKSTSVSMLKFMMQKLLSSPPLITGEGQGGVKQTNHPLKVGLAGNIGTPPLTYLNNQVDYLIMELSSFQITDLDYHLDYVMITNISQAHTDWHLSFENYQNDKLLILKYPETKKILNYQDKKLQEIRADNIIYYDNEEGFHVKDHSIFEGKEKLDLPPLQIFGDHNLSNICGVLTILKDLGLDYKKALSYLEDFSPLEHRLQRVYEKDGLVFINDSIATVADSVIAGVNSFNEDIALIVGGFDNSPDYSDLDKFIENEPKIKVALCLPDTGRMLKNSKCIHINNMREAITEAVRHLNKGIVLLSPAAPSFNLYKNYKERGLDFANLAKELMNETK